MRKLKEVLRLKLECGLKHRQIERAVGVSVGAVSKYCRLATLAGLSWPTIERLDDTEIERLLQPVVQAGEVKRRRIEPDYAQVHRELKRKGVKARQFMRDHESHLSLQRLRRNQPLTVSDLTELERMLVEAGGSPEVIKLATEQNHGLGIFIRSLVGLDRETAKQAFSQFVVGTTATASQLEFIDLIVQYLTENGTMDAARLYESPFTDISQQGPEAVFPVAKVTELVRVLDDIRERARA